MERRGPRHLLHQSIIAVEGIALRGEVFSQSLDKRLAAVAHHKVVAVESDDIILFGIELRKLHVISNLKIACQPLKGLTGQRAADEMHTRLELHATPPEALQATACLVLLLQHGDAVAILGKDHGGGQTAQSGADDNDMRMVLGAKHVVPPDL